MNPAQTFFNLCNVFREHSCLEISIAPLQAMHGLVVCQRTLSVGCQVSKLLLAVLHGPVDVAPGSVDVAPGPVDVAPGPVGRRKGNTRETGVGEIVFYSIQAVTAKEGKYSIPEEGLRDLSSARLAKARPARGAACPGSYSIQAVTAPPLPLDGWPKCTLCNKSVSAKFAGIFRLSRRDAARGHVL